MLAASVTSPVTLWRSSPATLVLGRDDVHVWRAMLNQTPSQIRNLHQNLAADEQARAARFYFEKDRKHFIVARGVLRAILGRYLNRAPECLSFCYSSYGKPALATEPDLNTIRFNLSHSYGIALYAVTRGRDVGIDLEHIRSGLASAQIAGRFFSPREIAMLQAFPAEMQNQAFFRCWTRKEAYIKVAGSRGTGHSCWRVTGSIRSLALVAAGTYPRPRLCSRRCRGTTRLASYLLAMAGSDAAISLNVATLRVFAPISRQETSQSDTQALQQGQQ
jgi:4'-phosphopantetheinyl transferase